MAQNPEKDYSRKSWIAVTSLLAILLIVSFLPPQIIGGIKFRRANILSDLLGFDDAPSGIESSLFIEEEFQVDMEQVADQIEADSAAQQVQTLYEWTLPKAPAMRGSVVPGTAMLTETLVPITDFGASHTESLQSFYDTLLLAKRPVRIAVMGDSFIEGDILTADLREKMQLAYGGGGTGFAPMASPLVAFRRTIRTQSRGWTAYNIMQRKNAPAALRENFYISGWVCLASDGAYTRWENTTVRQQLDSCTTGRIFFISPNNSRVEVTINDSERQEFAIEGNSSVRQIAVSAPRIRSLTFKVLSGAEGLIGYGAILESPGVVVDNYSIRSNNGQAMFWTNPSVNAQINAMLRYDLVILQYGLNIMQPGIKNFTDYGRQIEKMVTYVRQCFPGAGVLVMGVSDRAGKGEGGFAPMDAVPHMTGCQRDAAQRTAAAFWSTSDAMRAQGGIMNFVAKGWAGKDYTHINYAGGRRVAWSLFDAINAGVCRTYENVQVVVRQEQNRRAIADSIRMELMRWPQRVDDADKLPPMPVTPLRRHRR